MSDYLNDEIQGLLREQQKSRLPKARDMSMFMRFFILLMFFAAHFVCLVLYADVRNIAANGNGCNFRCANCGERQWQCSNNKDVYGQYHCVKCGACK